MLNSGQFDCLATTTGVLAVVVPINISHGHFLEHTGSSFE
jgi:hypothetical protein